MLYTTLALIVLSALSYLIMHEAKTERVGFAALVACVVFGFAAFVFLVAWLFS